MRKYIDIAALLNEGALTVREEGFGMKTLYNNEVALSGGMRSGSSPGHLMRIMYVIYDVPTLEKGEKPQTAECGAVHVWENQNGILGLVNIEVDKAWRRKGVGNKVIKALVDNCPHHFGISDIKPAAVEFWKSVGCRFFRGSTEIDPALIKKGGTYNGVIPKAGCSDEISEYADLNSNSWAKRRAA